MNCKTVDIYFSRERCKDKPQKQLSRMIQVTCRSTPRLQKFSSATRKRGERTCYKLITVRVSFVIFSLLVQLCLLSRLYDLYCTNCIQSVCSCMIKLAILSNVTYTYGVVRMLLSCKSLDTMQPGCPKNTSNRFLYRTQQTTCKKIIHEFN